MGNLVVPAIGMQKGMQTINPIQRSHCRLGMVQVSLIYAFRKLRGVRFEKVYLNFGTNKFLPRFCIIIYYYIPLVLTVLNTKYTVRNCCTKSPFLSTNKYKNIYLFAFPKTNFVVQIMRRHNSSGQHLP